MARLEQIAQQRLEKLARIRSQGKDPYPHSYPRSHTTGQAISLFESQEKKGDATSLELSLAGRISAMRIMGKIAFFDIRDGSGKIQIYCSFEHLGADSFQFLQELDIGDFIGVNGKLFRTKTGQITLDVADYVLLAKSLQPLPEKWHGLADIEKRYRQRYLDLIANEDVKQIFILRSHVIASIRNYLNQKEFIEVETPVLQPVAGGALARRFQTYHHALDEDLYLRIALELYLKRLIIGGMDKVYEIGRVFRNEGVSTKHNPEFTMLECYQAYADYNDVMTVTEDMICRVAEEVTGKTEIIFNDITIKLSPPWQRLSLRQVIHEKSGIDFEEHPDVASLQAKMRELDIEVDPAKDRGRLIDELISTFVEPHLIQPTFLVDYPIDMSPLAKRKHGNDHIVERFEGFIGGMEVANAFSELNDPLEQRERFHKQIKSKPRGSAKEEAPEIDVVDEDFLLSLEYGMPPTGGLGIGIDRLVMLLAGKQSIREVILFPQLKTK